jgi:hypothetical protein
MEGTALYWRCSEVSRTFMDKCDEGGRKRLMTRSMSSKKKKKTIYSKWSWKWIPYCVKWFEQLTRRVSKDGRWFSHHTLAGCLTNWRGKTPLTYGKCGTCAQWVYFDVKEWNYIVSWK